MCFAPQQRRLFEHLNLQKCSEVFCTIWLGNVLRATTACTFSTSQLQKVLRTWCALYILTSKCASRHNGVHFFDIATSKSAPKLRCFVHFDWNVVRATTACTVSTSQLPKVVRRWCVLYILTSECASRHNGVQLFISHLPSGLSTRRFSEPTFRPSGATNHWKNTVFRDFPTFSRARIFFLLRRSLLLIFFLLFSSLLFSDSSHLCFPFVHIVGSLASKLTSISETWDHKIKTMKPPASYKLRCVWSTVWFLDFLNLVDHMPRCFLFNPQTPFDLPAPRVNSWGICFLGKGKKASLYKNTSKTCKTTSRYTKTTNLVIDIYWHHIFE